MTKILYVASSMGHIENFHLPYIERLRRDGYTVKTMADGDDADYSIRFVKSILSVRNLLSQRKIRKIIKRENFDVIILNTTLAAFHTRMAMSRKRRGRVINIVHGYLFSQLESSVKSELLLLCERLLRNKTDAIAVMNEEDKKIAEKNHLCLGKVIMTRGFGARISEEKRSVEYIRRYTETADKFMICFVGELSIRKNQSFLISAMPKIKASVNNAVLVLVGDGELREELGELAQRLGVFESVRFVGYDDHPCDFMRACDLYASASESEGMPFNVIEALGCGAPILASDIKGHRDIILDGEDGYLYERGDVKDFAAKVKAFAIGDAGLDKDRQKEKYKKYSLEEVFPKTYSVIKDFCDGKN